MYAKVNNTRIFFDVEGMGFIPEGPIMRQKPVCFVLHGGPGGDHTAFKPSLTPLSELVQLIYIDNRGSGRSDRGPRSTYTLENNIADVEALREYLGLEKIILLGHSYGGMVSLSYAIKYPERAQGLLLITTSPSFHFIDRAKTFLADKGTPEQQEIAELLWNGSFESRDQVMRYYEIMEPLYAFSYHENTTEEEAKSKKDAKSRSARSYEALNEGFRGFLKTFDVRNQLFSITCPSLIIGGRHDWITPIEESIVLAENIPDNEFVIFENSSHSVFKDEHEHFISTTCSFIKRRFLSTEIKIHLG